MGAQRPLWRPGGTRLSPKRVWRFLGCTDLEEQTVRFLQLGPEEIRTANGLSGHDRDARSGQLCESKFPKQSFHTVTHKLPGYLTWVLGRHDSNGTRR